MRKKREKGHNQHGGRRDGAGRPLAMRGLLMRGLLTYSQAYIFETIVVKMYRHGQMRRVRTTRFKLVNDRLYEIAMTALNYKWLHYAMGKFESIEDAIAKNNYEAVCDKIFQICQNLKQRDPVYRSIIKTIVPGRKPTPFRDESAERSLADLKIQYKRELARQTKKKAQLAIQAPDKEGVLTEPPRETPKSSSNISEEVFNRIMKQHRGY